MITLKPLQPENVSPFYKWINDDDVIKYSLTLFLNISKKHEIDKWFTSLINNKTIANFGIFLETDGSLIGYAGICNFSKTNKSGEFYILIGEKNMWGKGIGALVAKKILVIGFEKHSLNRIFLTVSEPNIGGIKAYEKAGYKTEGKLREACFRDHQYHDKIIMAVLKSDWEKG